MRDALSNARSRTGDDSDLTCKRLHALEPLSFNLLGVNSRGLPAAVISMETTKRWLVLQSRESVEIGCGGEEAFHHRSEEHTSELQSLMRISYAVFCLTK